MKNNGYNVIVYCYFNDFEECQNCIEYYAFEDDVVYMLGYLSVLLTDVGVKRTATKFESCYIENNFAVDTEASLQERVEFLKLQNSLCNARVRINNNW